MISGMVLIRKGFGQGGSEKALEGGQFKKAVSGPVPRSLNEYKK
jgi:hypothetical protein